MPTVLGFDPLFQVIHEDDAARAIATALEHELRGVFNVAGPPPVPLSIIIRETGRSILPVPAPAINLLLGRFGLPRLPRGAVEHLKHPVVMDDRRFRNATDFAPRHDEPTILSDFCAAHPVPLHQ